MRNGILMSILAATITCGTLSVPQQVVDGDGADICQRQPLHHVNAGCLHSASDSICRFAPHVNPALDALLPGESPWSAAALADAAPRTPRLAFCSLQSQQIRLQI